MTRQSIEKLYKTATRAVDDWQEHGSLADIMGRLPHLSQDLSVRADNLLVARVDVTDFVAVPDNFSLAGVSVCSATIITGGFMGYGRMISQVVHAGRLVGLETPTQWLWATVGVVGVGTAVVVLIDARQTL